MPRRFLRDQNGASAAEFAMVLPLALLFLFGIIDAGRFMWEFNRAEKATQMGARYAAVTNMVPNTLASTSFVAGSVTQGDPIPTSSFASVSCTNANCTPSTWGFNSVTQGFIAQRIAAFEPKVTAANVIVSYANSGLGYAGDPNGSDVSPLVTVTVRNLTFQPITTILFNASFVMPDFSYSLTMEDGAGIVSN